MKIIWYILRQRCIITYIYIYLYIYIYIFSTSRYLDGKEKPKKTNDKEQNKKKRKDNRIRKTKLVFNRKTDVPPPDQDHRPWHIRWVDPCRRFFFSQWSCVLCFSKPHFCKVTIFWWFLSCFFANLIEIEAISCLVVLFFAN